MLNDIYGKRIIKVKKSTVKFILIVELVKCVILVFLIVHDNAKHLVNKIIGGETKHMEREKNQTFLSLDLRKGHSKLKRKSKRKQ